MPQQRIGRLQHPVVFVREDQQLARDAAALQRREGAQALRGGDAEVQVALDHQHRRLPVLHEVHGIELFVPGRRVVVGAAVFPFGEPQFFRRVSHAAVVEHAIVVDQALEAVRPVTGDPVHHVAAVRRAQRAAALAVQPREFFGGRFQAFLQVDQRLAAPVAADGIREFLAIAGRAVEVDEDGGVAGARIHLRIPAVAPAVAEAALRAAVD